MVPESSLNHVPSDTTANAKHAASSGKADHAQLARFREHESISNHSGAPRSRVNSICQLQDRAWLLGSHEGSGCFRIAGVPAVQSHSSSGACSSYWPYRLC
jgi:hypothetical protein